MASHVSLLVTGERDLKDRDLVWSTLDNELEHHTYDSVSLHVGDCETGADKFAREWWIEKHGEGARMLPKPQHHVYVTEPDNDGFRNTMFVFVADWDHLGLRAGPERNGRMARDFSDNHGIVAFAFWSGRREHRNKSGTLDCMEQLAQLGFDVTLVSTARRATSIGLAGHR